MFSASVERFDRGIRPVLRVLLRLSPKSQGGQKSPCTQSELFQIVCDTLCLTSTSPVGKGPSPCHTGVFVTLMRRNLYSVACKLSLWGSLRAPINLTIKSICSCDFSQTWIVLRS